MLLLFLGIGGVMPSRTGFGRSRNVLVIIVNRGLLVYEISPGHTYNYHPK
jgi:hypothetical protein